MPYGRRPRFGRRRYHKPPIEEQQKLVPANKNGSIKRQRCSGCGGFIVTGETALRFVLRKIYRSPCAHCANEPRRSRWYHVGCRPTDINKAMGFDPAQHGHAAPPPPVVNPNAPPKPATAAELTTTALASLEAALIAQVRQRKITLTAEMDKAFKTFQGLKSHVLRPTNDNEQRNAIKLALKKMIDLAWN